jgi:hypothetical protein
MLEELRQSGNLTFRNLADLKSAVGEEFHNVDSVNKGVKAAYAILSEKIDSILQRASGTLDPSLKPNYDQARQMFAFTSNLLPAIKKGVTRDVVNQSGKLANMGLLGAAIFGHPLSAGAAYIGKQGMKMAAPDFGSNLAYRTMTKGIPNAIPQGMNQALTDYLSDQYGPKQ